MFIQFSALELPMNIIPYLTFIEIHIASAVDFLNPAIDLDKSVDAVEKRSEYTGYVGLN
jgi:hypothetical protein